MLLCMHNLSLSTYKLIKCLHYQIIYYDAIFLFFYSNNLENHKMLNKVKKDPGRAMDNMFPDDLKSISNERSKVAVAKNEVRQFYLKAQKNIPVQKFADVSSYSFILLKKRSDLVF